MCTFDYGEIWQLFLYILSMFNFFILCHFLWLFFRPVLFKLCTTFIHILKMYTSYYGKKWVIFCSVLAFSAVYAIVGTFKKFVSLEIGYKVV